MIPAVGIAAGESRQRPSSAPSSASLRKLDHWACGSWIGSKNRSTHRSARKEESSPYQGHSQGAPPLPPQSLDPCFLYRPFNELLSALPRISLPSRASLILSFLFPETILPMATLHPHVQGTRDRGTQAEGANHTFRRGLERGHLRTGLRPPARTFSFCPQESVNRLHAQMQAFVSESKRAAELEEKRRYRFLAEKHLLLSNTFLQFLGRVSGAGERKPWPPESAVCRKQRCSFLLSSLSRNQPHNTLVSLSICIYY